MIKKCNVDTRLGNQKIFNLLFMYTAEKYNEKSIRLVLF